MPEQNEDTRRKFNNAIYHAKRWGLNAGQMKLWQALAQWFDENPDGPTNHELSEYAGVSYSLVYWYLPVLETLGIITRSRNRNGIVISRSIRLWEYPHQNS